MRTTKPPAPRKTSSKKQLIPVEVIERRIYILRSQKVMLSTHLAELYEVEPRALVQAVKRNTNRFPADFMFQLSAREFANLKSQIVISSWGGTRRSAPYAFTEQGVAMLSSVLNGRRAIAVNIAIIRAFVRLRHILAENKDLAKRVAALERKSNRNFKAVFTVLQQLTSPSADAPAESAKRPIGFPQPER